MTQQVLHVAVALRAVFASAFTSESDAHLRASIAKLDLVTSEQRHRCVAPIVAAVDSLLDR